MKGSWYQELLQFTLRGGQAGNEVSRMELGVQAKGLGTPVEIIISAPY